MDHSQLLLSLSPPIAALSSEADVWARSPTIAHIAEVGRARGVTSRNGDRIAMQKSANESDAALSLYSVGPLDGLAADQNGGGTGARR